MVGENFNVDPKNVSGYTLGEHGESQFVAWSTVSVNGLPIEQLAEERHLDLEDLERQARGGGWAVHSGKGYTSYAIATCAVKLSRAVLDDANLACPCSCYSDKYNTYVGHPAIVGKDGIVEALRLPITDAEEQKLAESAGFIREKFETLPAVKQEV